jgi:hypothetical protein
MIGAPFVATMLVILVAYEILARARGELPRNMLSPLILQATECGPSAARARGSGRLEPREAHAPVTGSPPADRVDHAKRE